MKNSHEILEEFHGSEFRGERILSLEWLQGTLLKGVWKREKCETPENQSGQTTDDLMTEAKGFFLKLHIGFLLVSESIRMSEIRTFNRQATGLKPAPCPESK